MPPPCCCGLIESCRICQLYHEDVRYRALWGGPTESSGPRRDQPCAHRGAVVGRTELEATGRGVVSLDVFACGQPGHGPSVTERDCRACSDYRPDTFRLIAPLGTAGQPLAWEGRSARRPWHYAVTAAVPHLDTPELLPVMVELLRLQSERPYIVVIDTGSAPEVCERLEALRAEDLEVHYVRGHGYINSSAPVTVAQDLALALCRTEYIFYTHADVFLRRRDFLAWMRAQCGPACPVIGYEMSPRDWATDQWHGMVSHTATLAHVPTLRRLGAVWNMEYGYELAGWEGKDANGWPDTETAFNLILRRQGVAPRLIGAEANFRRHLDDNIDHVRSYPGSKLYDPKGAYMSQARAEAEDALAQAGARIAAWARG